MNNTTYHNISVHLKVCKNKGHDRIWIEGKRLADMGYSKGMPFSKHLNNGELVLDFFDGKKAGKIAGTDTRPVIDFCGKWVTTFMAGAQHYEVIIGTGQITIRPV